MYAYCSGEISLDTLIYYTVLVCFSIQYLVYLACVEYPGTFAYCIVPYIAVLVDVLLCERQKTNI